MNDPRRATGHSASRAPAVALNCRFLETEMRGIGRYALALADALHRADPANVRCVFSGRAAPHLRDAAQRLDAHGVGPLDGPLWEQITLPAHLAGEGRPLLVNFVNTAPLLYRPQVTVVYDLSWMHHPESFTASFLALYRTVVPRVLRRSHVVTLSEFVKRELVAMGAPESRVDVVPAFVAPELLALAGVAQAAPAASDYALVVGSLNRRKNLQAALDAFHAAAIPGLRLRVVGESASVFRDTPLAGALSDRVDLLGAVSDQELAALYRGARFLLFPSLYEGFGLPPLEAMAFGCPVLATSASSVPEVCGDAALYCDPMNVQDIATQMQRIATDESLRDTLRQRGFARARRYSVEQSGAMMVAVVARALREAGRQPEPSLPAEHAV